MQAKVLYSNVILLMLVFMCFLLIGCASTPVVEVIQSPTTAPSNFTQELENQATQEDPIKLEDIPTTPQEQTIQLQ